MSEHLLDWQHALPPIRDASHHPEFHVYPDSADGVVHVRLEGELDMSGAPRLGHVLNAALDDPGSAAVVLDLTGLTFIDSTGVRVLISGQRRARILGCSFALRFPNRSVMKVLRLTGVDRLLVIEGAPPSP